MRLSFFKVLLWCIDKLFQITRKRMKPVYPYNRKTQQIRLPKNIEDDIYQTARDNKVKAVKKVTELTGAGLRISKDYVDQLLTDKVPK